MNISQLSHSSRELFDYQQQAIDFWFANNCTGIFEMATGTGKTFTTIEALRRFQNEKGFLQAVVAVPLAGLVRQWHDELVATLPECLVVLASGADWRERIMDLARVNRLSDRRPSFIIVATYNLLNRADFKELMRNFSGQLVLVADEVHNLVTQNGIRTAKSDLYAWRLGLSATPCRLWRPKASQQLTRVFGNRRFVFTLEQAIERGFLVPFNYHPVIVKLNSQEFADYTELSRRIRRKMAGQTIDDMEDSDDEQLKNLLLMRARIKKEAEAKIEHLLSILLDLRRKNDLHHALIYVDNEEYLLNLQQKVNEKHIMTAKIVGGTAKNERERITQDLEEKYIDAIVAIKCLDEGIDIPAAQKAFILANSTEPREYVQRLGRVLRIDRKNPAKTKAEIYDFIVVPSYNEYIDEDEENAAKKLIRSELIRTKFFTELAMNGAEMDFELFKVAESYGFVFRPEELCYNSEEE